MVSGPITQSRLSAFQLPLVRPWQFGEHVISGRSGWLLHIADESGNSGWGEATPFPQIGTEAPAQAREWLTRAMEGLQGRTPEQALAALEAPEEAPPAARCGLECTLLDLQARRRGLPLARLLHPDAGTQVAVHAALGSLERVQPDDLARAFAAGFRCAKIKLGSAPALREIELLERLLASLPAGLQLRLDANRAWDPATARDLLGRLDPARVDLVEEPLARGDPASWKALRQASPVALALDESLKQGNLEEILAQHAAHSLVLKPMRLGGLLPCLDVARRARQAGMGCLVTTSLDGALASAAAAHLAAAVDAIGPAPVGSLQVHGLATSTLLARDLTRPLPVAQGHITLPNEPGLGLRPDTDIEKST